MRGRVVLLAIGGLLFVTGLVITLMPFTGTWGPASNRRTVSCRSPLLDVALEDTSVDLAAIERLDDDAPGESPSPEELRRVAALQRGAEVYRACQKPAAARSRLGSLLEAAGIAVAGIVLVRHRWATGRGDARLPCAVGREPT